MDLLWLRKCENCAHWIRWYARYCPVCGHRHEWTCGGIHGFIVGKLFRLVGLGSKLRGGVIILVVLVVVLLRWCVKEW